MLSERVGRQRTTGSPRPRLAKAGADRVEIADDRASPDASGWMCCASTRPAFLGVTLLDPRDELGEVVVGQVVERELHDAARNLLGGLEVARVAARERRDAERELVARDRPRSADAVDLADRFLDRLGRSRSSAR